MGRAQWEGDGVVVSVMLEVGDNVMVGVRVELRLADCVREREGDMETVKPGDWVGVRVTVGVDVADRNTPKDMDGVREAVKERVGVTDGVMEGVSEMVGETE